MYTQSEGGVAVIGDVCVKESDEMGKRSLETTCAALCVFDPRQTIRGVRMARGQVAQFSWTSTNTTPVSLDCFFSR